MCCVKVICSWPRLIILLYLKLYEPFNVIKLSSICITYSNADQSHYKLAVVTIVPTQLFKHDLNELHHVSSFQN